MKRLLCVVAFFAAAASAHAADTVGWHVVSQGETLQGITVKYLGDASAWKEVWKLNPEIRNPDVLTPGQRIRVILQRTLPARSALIRRVSRRVEKKPEPDPWQPARAGDQLAERHGVQTFAAASAELRFEDDSVLTLTERSLVFLRSARSVTARRDRSEIEIVDGQGDLEKPAQAKRRHDIEITVGTAKARPQQGPARARFQSVEKSARVMSYRGATSVSGAGASVDVKEGMGVSVPEGGRPSKPERLLPSPKLAATEVHEPRPLLQWAAVPKAASYTVEVCRDRGCAEVIARATGIEGTSWRSDQSLAAGPAYWRVTARSANGLDGYPAVAALAVRAGISGTIVADSQPVAGAAVSLYAGGTPVRKTATGRDGTFVFGVPAAGEYAIVVDSRSFGREGSWAEQTEGPAGSLCGERRLEAAGPCPGGRRAGAGDDARSLEGAEHVALIAVGEAPVGNADFRFSFNAVTGTEDSGQGSLRQFLANANAIEGPNEMLFLPAHPPDQDGRWTLRPTTPLPPLTDAGTAVDGRDRRPGAGHQARPHEFGTVTFVGGMPLELENPDAGSLTIDFGGAALGLDARAEAAVRNVALRGAALHIRAGAGLRVENVMIGTLLSRSEAAGIELLGPATLRRVLITALSGEAVTTRPGARLEADHLEVSDCAFGSGAAGALLLQSRQSRIRNSLFLLNTGAPAVRMNGSPDAIDDSTFRGNRIALSMPIALAQVVRRALFQDNVVNAIASDAGPPDVSRVGLVEDGSTHVTGTATGARRVEVLAPGAHLPLEVVAGADVSADGSFDLALPPGR